jgi:hypothetical protein
MTSQPAPPARKGRRAVPPVERFLPKVDRRGPDDCWPWTAGTSGNYGCFRIRQGVSVTAHSFAKFADTGIECPPGMEAQHTCRTDLTPLCCNPHHIVYAKPGAAGTRRRGLDHPNGKLSDDQIREIRLRAAAGEGPTALAREYGVSQPYASNVISRTSRAHVV